MTPDALRRQQFEALAAEVWEPLQRYLRRRADAAVAEDLPVALAGSATAVSAQEVRLEVDRWYVGGDADVAVLRPSAPEDSARAGGTEFTVGSRYLVSASEGPVSVCGYSGPASPELQAVYDEAFGG